MYKFKDQINTVNFFRFNKALVKGKIWPKLPRASQAIYPVICCHCNARGEAYPSQKTIGILSGHSEKTVREGLKGLIGLHGFETYSYISGRGHRGIRYKVTFPPWQRGLIFLFHKAIIDGGNWSLLTPTAQALYPVLRTYAFFDHEEYMMREDDFEIDADEFLSLYKNRDYDFVDVDVDILSEYAGISKQSVRPALNKLKECFLIEDTHSLECSDRTTWKIFPVPLKYFNRDYLNNSNKKYLLSNYRRKSVSSL